MIGIELTWHNENGHVVEESGPYFSQNELPLADVKEFFAEGGNITVRINEYLGNLDDGYDFNSPWRSIRCLTVEMFANTIKDA